MDMKQNRLSNKQKEFQHGRHFTMKHLQKKEKEKKNKLNKLKICQQAQS